MKPKVLVLTLGSMERHGWVNPCLSFSLLTMAKDARFDTSFGNILDCQPHDYARNVALSTARQENPDWCVLLDNDNAPALSPLDLIADAPADADVIGVRYGVGKECEEPRLYPSGVQFVGNGSFAEVPRIGGGVLCIRSTVWQKLPKGPWFQLVRKPGAELMEVEMGEDSYFCELVRWAGMKVYVHKTPAKHFHTRDLTKIVML